MPSQFSASLNRRELTQTLTLPLYVNCAASVMKVPTNENDGMAYGTVDSHILSDAGFQMIERHAARSSHERHVISRSSWKIVAIARPVRNSLPRSLYLSVWFGGQSVSGWNSSFAASVRSPRACLRRGRCFAHLSRHKRLADDGSDIATFIGLRSSGGGRSFMLASRGRLGP